MRKGLVITLGVVALVLVVSPGFAVAPIISCVPDIIVSDFEDSQTIDNNLFIFSDAIDLDEYVSDADTTNPALLRWSFIQSGTGPVIELNGIGSNTSGNNLAPGAFDIRAISNLVDVRNVDWSPVAGALPHPDPTGSPADSMLELYVSDGTNLGNQTMKVTSIDESAAGPGDRLLPQASTSFGFDAGDEGWTWFSAPTVFTEPAHSAAGSALQITAAAGGTNIVFGGWESPKDPALAGSPRFGCILRGRFAMRSSADGATVPGFRTKAVTTKVTDTINPPDWNPDFVSLDINVSIESYYLTPDPVHVTGREPGIAGKTYAILSWPQQTDSLMTTTVVTYFGCDLLDLDKDFSDDSGTLFIDSVDIDGIDRPAPGTGTPVPGLSTTDFTSFVTSAIPVSGGANVNPTYSSDATGITITLGPTAAWFDCASVGPAVALDAGGYYRAIFTVTSSATPGGDFGPTIRAGFVSSTFVGSVVKNLPGGGLLSAVGSTPEPFEVWMEAPPVAAPATQTEPYSVRFQSWLGDHNTGFPFNKNVSGTVRCTEVVVEQFPVPATQ